MDKELITIVLPVYNVEAYLEKCLDSILKQTYRNFELIIVNDGSTDNSFEICKKYEKKDKRIIILNKENGGLSDARNFGINKASGEYITFIDSDDYIDDDYLEYLYNLCKKNNTKISICAHTVVSLNGKKIEYGKNLTEKKMKREECLVEMFIENGFTVSAWAKMYKLELFKNVRYPKGRLCEDNGTTYKLIDKVDFISYGNDSKYYYVKRKDSIMGSQFNEKKLDMITLTDEMCEYFYKKDCNFKDVLERRRIYARFNVLRQMVFSTKRNFELEDKIVEEILINKKEILKKKYSPLRDKIATIILSMFGKEIFAFSWKIYCLVKY